MFLKQYFQHTFIFPHCCKNCCFHNDCWNSRQRSGCSHNHCWNSCANNDCWNSRQRNGCPTIIVGTVVSTLTVGTVSKKMFVSVIIVGTVVPTITVGTAVPTIIVLMAYYWKSCPPGITRIRNPRSDKVKFHKP